MKKKSKKKLLKKVKVKNLKKERNLHQGKNPEVKEIEEKWLKEIKIN